MATDPENIAGYKDALTGAHDGPAVDGAAQVRPAAAPELQSLLSVAVGALVVAALYFGQEVLIPITLAVMLSFVLSPVVAMLQRLRLWRAPAVIVTVLAAIGLLGGIGTLLGNQAASLAVNAPAYAQRIENKVQNVQGFAFARLAAVTRSLGSHPVRDGASGAAGGGSMQDGAGPQPVPVRLVAEKSTPLTIARTVLAPILGPLETTIIVLIVAIFILMQKEDLRDRFIRLFGSNDLHRTTRAMDDAGQRLSRYFLSQLAVNACFGTVIALGLWLIGVPSSAMWGAMAGLLRFVPYIGSLLAAVAPAALAAAVDPGWTMAIEVLVLFLVAEPITGYVVEPLLYGHSTGLSPVSVIVSAIFWTWLWGPIGLIMSTPLTLILVVMGRHVKSLEFFDVLLGDRPALTPVETFYQRILANNPDEALAQAEALLPEKPLLAYYEEVVLAGLKLAVEDQARGTLDFEREVQMARTMKSVVGDLAEHARPAAETAEAEAEAEAQAEAAEALAEGETPERRPVSALLGHPIGPVACVAGSGPFDEVVTAILAQLLDARGATVRTVSNAATSRDRIASLDLAGIRVIAISYLELTGSPAQLRYLIRRLRAHAPKARIVVGLWPQGEAALSDAVIQRTIGSDLYVGSLADAVEAIVAEGTEEQAEAA